MRHNVKKRVAVKPFRAVIGLLLLMTMVLSSVVPGFSAFAADVPDTTTLTASCRHPDGGTFRVTVTYGADAGIPDDASLAVQPISCADAAYAAYTEQAADALGCDAGTATSALLFNISLVSKNNAAVEYQPLDGASVDVKVRMADAIENEFGVVHFGEDAPEVLDSSVAAAGKTVSFETTGFSVYAFVDIVGGDSLVTDKTAFDEAPLYISVTSKNSGKVYYLKGNIVAQGNQQRIARTNANSTEGAVAYSFEKLPGTTDHYYMYCGDGNGGRNYVKLTNNNRVDFLSTSSSATEFTVVPCANKDNKFYLSFRNASDNKIYYLNMRSDDAGFGFSGSTYSDENAQLTFVQYLFTEEILNLDGQSYGLAIPVIDNSDYTKMSTAAILTAEANGSSAIAARTCNVRANPLVSGNDVIIDADHDIVTYTFHAIDKEVYYLTTQVGGATKYLRMQDGALTLVDTPDQYARLVVNIGKGAMAGMLRITSAVQPNMAISLNNNSVANGFVGKNVSDKTTYLKLLTPTILGDDDFVPYSAIKVSVSDKDHVYNGSQVVVYTRIWNSNAKEYEFYAINHDGSLVRVYDEGDTIRWAGTQVNTLLWDFTEYYYWPTFLKIPNHYYELQNVYSGKYIAPQYHTGQILSDNTIGINLNGRRYGDYYTTILAWDDYRYGYASLRTNSDNTSVESVSMSKAQDFYFAIMDDPVPAQFTTVDTVDNDEHGIKMRMINIQGNVSGGRNSTQTAVMGSDTTNFTAQVPTLNLVTTDLDENGYPIATHTNTSLEALFGDATAVNHLFLDSTYRESGYFEYNCTQTFASLRSNGDFRLYNQLGTVQTTTPSQGHGWFMPFNDISPDLVTTFTNVSDVHNQPLATNDPRLGETLYAIPLSEAQYYFGMEMQASFIQSKDGLDAWGHDIIFEFAGDDDMWLYVDGELVLDLGGVHSALVGKINFRTGMVEIPDLDTAGQSQKTTTLRALFEQNYRARNPQATNAEVLDFLNRHFKEGTTIFKDYTSHTMKMYYMERGAGASNLHMRFNLTTATDGQLLLKKKVSGTDKEDYASMQFPYQIWYFDKTSAEWRRVSREETTVEGKTAYEYEGVTFVNYEGTSVPVEYADEFNGIPNVFFLKPGETAEIQFPDDTTEYKIVECHVDTTIYDEVYVNEEQLTGVQESGNFYDFSTEPEVIGERKVAEFTNHVDEDALRTLTITKWLYDEKYNRLNFNADDPDNDDTGFRFRVYIGEGTDTEDGLGYYRFDKYYVKDPAGNYCYYDHDNQKFASIGKKVFSALTDDDLEACTFITSPSGAIDKIPADHSVEIRNLLIDTRFLIEERDSDIPKGYDWFEYKRVDGSYIVEEGNADNEGTIRANQNPHIVIKNHRGWGLTVEKVWSDVDFMDSHDNIYFAVYCKGELVSGTVRRMQTEVTSAETEAETSIYYYFKELQENTQFADYSVKEVSLTNPTVDANGIVTAYDSLTVLGGVVQLTNGGIPSQTGKRATFDYNVSYDVGEPGGPAKNIRTDVVTNSRPGIRLVKQDGAGGALAGAVFSLVGTKTSAADGSAAIVTEQTLTSDSAGLITNAYPESGVTYTLTETQTPDGYSAIMDSLTFYQGEDGIIVDGADGKSVVVSEPESDGTIVITIKNYETEITAVKVDSGNRQPVAGAHFAIYRQVTGKNGLMRDYYPMAGYADLVTGEDGVIPGFDITLPVGTYYLSETQAPSGYYVLDHDILFSVTADGLISVLSESDSAMLSSELSEDNKLTCTLTIPNRRTMKTIELTPQTLVADFGLDITYDVTENNHLVPENSAYSYVGITSEKNYDAIGTYECPALLAEAGQTYQGKYGKVTLAANGVAVYDVTSMAFTGEDNFYLVAHVTNISGTDANLYVYEMLTFIPATTVYYEDDFVSDQDHYIDGTEGTATGYDFGHWTTVSSGSKQTEQAADLAGHIEANTFGYDPAYLECGVYSNNSAHKVSVADINATNKGGKWPTMSFDFAGTGFDVVSVTGCDTGVFTVKVYLTEVDAEGNVTVGKQVKSQIVDTYYGYDYGPIYMDENGAPTLTVTDTRLYEATEEIIQNRIPGSLITAGGKQLTPTVTYHTPDGEKSETPYYYDLKGNVTATQYYIDTATNSVVGADKVTKDINRFIPNYAYAEASGWLLNHSADQSLYQIPVIKISGLEYGSYRAVLEPRFTAAYGHYETADNYKYFDLYVDAFRIYDPAGSGIDGTLTSKVIQEAYNYSSEAFERFTTLKNVIVGVGSMGVYDENDASVEGAVLVDGSETLNAERMQEYAAFGPQNELYLSRGMSVAFELNSSITPADVQLQMKKISTANPTLRLIYYSKEGVLVQESVPINTATDLSYSLVRLMGDYHLNWTKTKSGDVSSGLIIVSNVGDENSIISITNLKWTFTSANGTIPEKSLAYRPTVSGTSASGVKKAIALSKKSIAVQTDDTAAAVYEDGQITITVNTGSDVDSLVITDLYGNEIAPEVLEYSFTDLNEEERQWTVTVSEDEDGTHNYLIHSAGEDFVSGASVRVVVTVDNPAEIVPEEAEEPNGNETEETTGDVGETPASEGKTSKLLSFFERIKGLWLRFIDMLRRLLSVLGISIGNA